MFVHHLNGYYFVQRSVFSAEDNAHATRAKYIEHLVLIRESAARRSDQQCSVLRALGELSPNTQPAFRTSNGVFVRSILHDWT
jgi:hypothetical protein